MKKLMILGFLIMQVNKVECMGMGKQMLEEGFVLGKNYMKNKISNIGYHRGNFNVINKNHFSTQSNNNEYRSERSSGRGNLVYFYVLRHKINETNKILKIPSIIQEAKILEHDYFQYEFKEEEKNSLERFNQFLKRFYQEVDEKFMRSGTGRSPRIYTSEIINRLLHNEFQDLSLIQI